MSLRTFVRGGSVRSPISSNGNGELTVPASQVFTARQLDTIATNLFVIDQARAIGGVCRCSHHRRWARRFRSRCSRSVLCTPKCKAAGHGWARGMLMSRVGHASIMPPGLPWAAPREIGIG